ncbi:MAG: Crp/Fnr family transcriptional regulator [Bacteroidetes bacterium]|nr:Crp/Fnr family transcriptional regulator [Bacteroidota bacterium]
MLETSDIRYFKDLFKELRFEELESLLALAQVRRLNAGEVYIPAGATWYQIAYIRKGLIRTWCRKDGEVEITVMLRWEDQFVGAMDSILFHRPSRFIYQALEETELVELDYREAEPIINSHAGLSAARNSFLLHMLSMSMDRVENFVLLSPEERYRKMLADKPDIVNRVPDKYVATLLGITPVSLSRIRRRMAQGKRDGY